jgi:two-component system chemotaxis response regulator CheY
MAYNWPRLSLKCAMPIDYSQPVLVVNDVRSMTDIITSMLKKIGFTHVDAAENGAVAIIQLGMKKYSLVVSDWKMAPVNGLQLLDIIRRTPPIADTPFILVTAHRDLQYESDATKAGADAYISIPCSLATLKTRITEILER